MTINRANSIHQQDLKIHLHSSSSNLLNRPNQTLITIQRHFRRRYTNLNIIITHNNNRRRLINPISRTRPRQIKLIITTISRRGPMMLTNSNISHISILKLSTLLIHRNHQLTPRRIRPITNLIISRPHGIHNLNTQTRRPLSLKRRLRRNHIV